MLSVNQSKLNVSTKDLRGKKHKKKEKKKMKNPQFLFFFLVFLTNLRGLGF